MSEPHADAHAGAASVGATAPPPPDGAEVVYATELLASGEYGVRFTSGYEPGGDYPPVPPPPAEQQHAQGLHPGAEGGE
jgi:hypothetical protein